MSSILIQYDLQINSFLKANPEWFWTQLRVATFLIERIKWWDERMWKDMGLLERIRGLFFNVSKCPLLIKVILVWRTKINGHPREILYLGLKNSLHPKSRKGPIGWEAPIFVSIIFASSDWTSNTDFLLWTRRIQFGVSTRICL